MLQIPSPPSGLELAIAHGLRSLCVAVMTDLLGDAEVALRTGLPQQAIDSLLWHQRWTVSTGLRVAEMLRIPDAAVASVVIAAVRTQEDAP